jgi:hypothetical protein
MNKSENQSGMQREVIAKVELMFKSKQKLIKKAFKLKLQQLRVQN